MGKAKRLPHGVDCTHLTGAEAARLVTFEGPNQIDDDDDDGGGDDVRVTFFWVILKRATSPGAEEEVDYLHPTMICRDSGEFRHLGVISICNHLDAPKLVFALFVSE